MSDTNNICCRLWNCFKYEDHDITAWLKTATARAPTTIVVALFSAAALLFIAGEIKDCDDDNVDLGFISLQVSSVLAITQVIENVINLFLAPFLGTLADSSLNRKYLLIFSSTISVTSFGIGGFLLLGDSNLTILWLFIICLVITSIFYELSLLLVFAYLPEIVHDMEELTTITSRQYAIVNGSQLATAIVLGGASIVLAETFESPLIISAVAHFVVVIWFLYFGIPGIYYLPNKTNKKQEEEEKIGVCSQLYLTTKDVFNKYPQVGWFLAAWTFYFAGIAAVTVLQVAYTAEEFGFEVDDIAILGVLLLIFSVIGAALCEVIAKRVRLKTILMYTLILWTLLAFIAPWLLRGEDILISEENITIEYDDNGCILDPIDRQPDSLASFMVYIVSILFGLGIGFIYPTNTAIYALIIPGGEEATYFGLKIFCAKLLAWAPSALFALLNESTENLQLAFMSIGFFFLLSLPFAYMLDVDKGIEDVKDTLHKRQGVGALLYGDRRLSVDEIKDEESKVLDTVNPVFAAADDIMHHEHHLQNHESDTKDNDADIKEFSV